MILLLLVAIVAGVFWQVRGFDFVNLDDNILVYQNPYYNPATATALPSFWREPYKLLYIPVTYAVWGILASLARVVPLAGEAPLSQLSPVFDPSIFHSANLMFHVLSVLLVFGILRLLVKSDWAAACGALLFGLHPVQVESVAWVSELKGVLCGFFTLAALWLYLLCATRKNSGQELQQPGTSSKELMLYGLATLAFILAFLSKPAAAALPLVALVLELGFLKRPRKEYLPFLLVWLGLMCLAIFIARSAQPPAAPELIFPLWQRPFIAGDALAFYLAKLVYPLELAVHYSRSPRWVLDQPWAYIQWLAPAAVLAAAWWQRHRRPVLLAGVGIFFVALLPVWGLVPFVFQEYSTVADRYLYFPMLGPALALAGTLAVAFNRDESASSPSAGKSWFSQSSFLQWPLLLCSLVLFACAALTFRQLGHWRDAIGLYEHTIAVNPRASIAHANLGALLKRQGKVARAELHYREAVRLDPRALEAHLNLGVLLDEQGKSGEAAAYFEDVIAKGEKFADAYYHWGILLAGQGDTQKAEKVLRRGIVQKQTWAPLHVALGLVLIQRADNAQGKAEIEIARRLQSDNVDLQIVYIVGKWSREKAVASVEKSKELKFQWAQAYHNLGVARLQRGEKSEAIGLFQSALKIRPDMVQTKKILSELASSAAAGSTPQSRP